jgi:hypothetical protein
MPVTIRRSHERGHAKWSWLDTHHTFSFGDYRDRAWVRYRSLRVLNDDVIAPGAGFGTHPHQNMEILSFILRGELAHQDSTGGGGVLRPGDVQVMSAGRGIEHSEFNASKQDDVRLIQTWILPREAGLEPLYAQRGFGWGENGWTRVAGGSEREDDALRIQQDAEVFVASPVLGTSFIYDMRPERGAWLHVGEGAITIRAAGEEHDMKDGDGASIENAGRFTVVGASERTRLILFDLA